MIMVNDSRAGCNVGGSARCAWSSGGGGRLMAEVLGTWAGIDRRVGAVRRWLLNKPELEREALAQVRARLDRVLEELVADGARVA
jgi:hypothetical protein